MDTQTIQNEPPHNPAFNAGYLAGQQFLLNPYLIQDIQESCTFKTMFSAIIGGGMGFAIGAIFRTGVFSPIDTPNPNLSLLKQVTEGFKESGKAGWGMAKTFTAVGALFTASECYIEKGRAKCDLYNSIGAGCFSGAALAASQGIKAQAIGCVGFAAFSIVIDELTERHGSSETAARHDDYRYSSTPSYLSEKITAEDLITPIETKKWYAKFVPWDSNVPKKNENNNNVVVENNQVKIETNEKEFPKEESNVPQAHSLEEFKNIELGDDKKSKDFTLKDPTKNL